MPTKPAAGKTMEIKLAHSPDSDDAFMFYGLATHKVQTPGLKFSHLLADIETLNKAASEEIYDVTAFSFGAYPYLRDKYVLLDCGASFGEGYGPIVVSQHPLKREDLAKCRVAVPGLQKCSPRSISRNLSQIPPRGVAARSCSLEKQYYSD
jgi:1,4-dihydroxy-6-naphthoate synthase